MEERLIQELSSELARARLAFAPFNSAHEGYAVLLEEVEELKLEVFKKKQNRDMRKMKNEAIQVAAMAIRFITDVVEV